MQTTLLGLAIALILALVAALAGPYFVDWNQFRSRFEVEATRIAGAPVRVDGALDARLLPTPTLRLRDVAFGGEDNAAKLHAEKLDVEFSLGSLLRGEWRATELTINGAAIAIGLDQQGQVEWPLSAAASGLNSLAIDRLNLTGRVTLRDAASGASIDLDDLAFSGDVRAPAGAVRGDGNFRFAGDRYPFRLSSSPVPEGTRVRLVLDRAEADWAADFDGLLNWDARSPRFEGAVILSGSVAAGSAPAVLRIPWRVSAKLRADPSMARLDQVETTYGNDAPLKLAGQGDVLFGAAPSLRATLAARQIDADRFLANLDVNQDQPVVAKLRSVMSFLPTMPVLSQIELRAEQVTFGGRPMQGLLFDLRGGLPAWTIDRFEARAPGDTAITLAGRTLKDASRAIDGALSIESADPGVFLGWLQGRNDNGARGAKPFKLEGQVEAGSDRIAVSALRAEIEGGKLAGSLALMTLADGGTRLDTTLRADRIDLDAAAAALKSLGASLSEWPKQAQVSLDFGIAISAGQELKPLILKFQYEERLAMLDELRIGGATGIAMSAKGTLDRAALTSSLSANLRADSFKQIGAMIAPYAPAVASRLDAMPGNLVQMKIGFVLDKDASRLDRAAAQATINIDASQASATASIAASPTLAALRAFDVAELWRTDFKADVNASAPSGRNLIALLGLDRALSAGETPLRVEGSIVGATGSPSQLKAKAIGSELDADVSGTVERQTKEPKASLSLVMRKGNLAPLLGGVASDTAMKDIALRTRINLTGDRIELGDLDSTIGGSRVRGRIAFDLGDDRAIDGELGMDKLDLAAAFGYVIGTRGRVASEPLRTTIANNWSGRLAFQALRGVLPGGLEVQQVGGLIKGDRRAVTFDAVKGALGGGEAQADIEVRQGNDGLSVSGRFQMSGVDGSALRYRGLAMPPGKTSLKMTLTGQGRSEAALVGGLFGNGLVSLEGARIAGLNPRMFDVAARASDAGQASDDAKLLRIVETALSEGSAAVQAAQIPFTIKDSRLRVAATTLDGEDVRLVVSGGYDIPADQIDVRASMTPGNAIAGAMRPEVQMFAVGPPDGLSWTTDIAALSSWLAVRSIDRETRRLDAIERGETPFATAPPAVTRPMVAPDISGALPEAPSFEGPLPGRVIRRMSPKPRPSEPRAVAPAQQSAPEASAQQVAPLPPAIDVRPVPGIAPGAARPKPRPPLDLTPQPLAPR